jgi:hypothetical protein
MTQKASIAILAAFLAIGALLVFWKVRREPLEGGGIGTERSVPSNIEAGPGVQPAPLAEKVTVPILYSSEKEEWLRDAVAEFAKDHPNIDVELEAKGSLEAVRALLSGEKKPVLWSPADSLAVNLLSTQWQLAKGADPLVRNGTIWPRSLLLTPLVFVGWESRAKTLLGGAPDLTWTRLRDAVASKKGWAGLGGDPAWAYVKFGHTDPAKSNSGLQTLVLMAYGFYDRQVGLTVPDVTSQRFQDFVRAIEAGRRSQDFAASSTGPFMENFIRQGPSLYDFIVVYEATAIAEMPRAAGRWESLRVFYPSVNVWSDHPMCLLNTDWVTPAQRQAATLLVDYLMTPAVQQRALRHGFRPGNLDVPVVSQDPDNPFNRYRTAGVRVEVPRIASTPDGVVLQALLQTYQRNAPN